MPSPTRTLRLPPDLADAAEIRAQALGYPNWTAYVKGLIRYDLLVQGEHTLTRPWADLPLTQQDKIDANLLSLTRRGKGERGQFLKHLLEGAKGDVEALTKKMTKFE